MAVQLLTVAVIIVLLVPREFLEVPDDSNFVLGGRLTLGNPGDSSFPGLLMRLFEVRNRRVGVDHPDDVFLVVGFFVHLTVTVRECYNRRYDVDFMRIRKWPSGKEIAGWMSPWIQDRLTLSSISIYRVIQFSKEGSMLKKSSGKGKSYSGKPTKAAQSLTQSRVGSFDEYYQGVMSKKHHQCQTIESPQLNERLNEINSHFEDVLLSGLSSPANRASKTHQRLERRKYQGMKERIYQSVVQFQQMDVSSLSLLFAHKQKILGEFLNGFNEEISKECREKGDILRYIWNSMFAMIEHISERLSAEMRKREERELKENIQQHRTYQKMLENIKNRHDDLQEKNVEERTTISRLVYELRVKRKEVDRLYKTQKLLENRLNELKADNIHIQTSYIDIVSSIKDLPPQSVEQMLRAREELNRDRDVKIKVSGSRKKNKVKAEEDIGESKGEMGTLLQQIKEIATNQGSSPNFVSTMIGAAIENFGITHDDNGYNREELIEVRQNSKTADFQIQVNLLPTKQSRIERASQTSYSDKINFDLLSNMVTQTQTEVVKKRVFMSQGTEMEDIRKKYVAWNFSIVRTVTKKIVGQEVGEQPRVNRSQKKHFSGFHQAGRGLGKKRTGYSELYLPGSVNSFKKESEGDLSEAIGLEMSKLQEKGLEKKFKDRKLQKKTSGQRKSVLTIAKRISGVNSRRDSNGSRASKSLLPSELLIREGRVRDSLNESVENGSVSSGAQNSRRKATRVSAAQYEKIKSVFSQMKFPENNGFNLSLDEDKQSQVFNFFVKDKKNNYYLDNLCEDSREEEEDSDGKELEEEVIAGAFENIDMIKTGNKHKEKKATACSSSKRAGRIENAEMAEEQQDMLLNLCRNKYFKRAKKEGGVPKYREELTKVKDRIEMIADDVGQMLAGKEDYFKKVVGCRNIKNIYKILMMTFAKAYDCYNRGGLVGNLVFPLFESLSLIYGNIKTSQVYKRMISFIAMLSVKTENSIFRFFLFFLGLDRQSLYSQHVTISEVYLCLSLLEKISVQSKVTLSIDSVYTDTERIKEELIGALREENIPDSLCQDIKWKVDQELEGSTSLRNSGHEEARLKINIYNIILLVIQEVIKCKLKMKERFLPILECCKEYQEHKRAPLILLETLLDMCINTSEQQNKVLRLIGGLSKASGGQGLPPDQFFSILFENNLISLRLVIEQNYLPLSRLRIPQEFCESVQLRLSGNLSGFQGPIEYFEHQVFSKLVKGKQRENHEQAVTVETMKKLVFVRHYLRKVQEVWKEVVGEQLLDAYCL